MVPASLSEARACDYPWGLNTSLMRRVFFAAPISYGATATDVMGRKSAPSDGFASADGVWLLIFQSIREQRIGCFNPSPSRFFGYEGFSSPRFAQALQLGRARCPETPLPIGVGLPLFVGGFSRTPGSEREGQIDGRGEDIPSLEGER